MAGKWNPTSLISSQSLPLQRFTGSEGFPGGSGGKGGKESTCNEGTPGLIPESGIFPGEGNGDPLQYSCLKIPWTEETDGLQFMEFQSQTQMSNYHFHLDSLWHIYFEIKFSSLPSAPSPSFLADACWCMAKPIQYCKVKKIISKKRNFQVFYWVLTPNSQLNIAWLCNF